MDWRVQFPTWQTPRIYTHNFLKHVQQNKNKVHSISMSSHQLNRQLGENWNGSFSSVLFFKHLKHGYDFKKQFRPLAAVLSRPWLPSLEEVSVWLKCSKGATGCPGELSRAAGSSASVWHSWPKLHKTSLSLVIIVNEWLWNHDTIKQCFSTMLSVEGGCVPWPHAKQLACLLQYYLHGLACRSFVPGISVSQESYLMGKTLAVLWPVVWRKLSAAPLLEFLWDYVSKWILIT